MANDEHVALLKQGVAAWNAWRDEKPTSGLTSAGRTSAGRSSTRRGSAGRTSTGRTSARRSSTRRTSAKLTSSGRTSATSKAVLILGRFTDERKAVLDALRDELRKRNYLPILFDFDKQRRDDHATCLHVPVRYCRHF
jgi:hypothetical protein